MRLAVAMIAIALYGCASPKIEYRPAPDYLIPLEPELPKIESAALQCLSNKTYIDLATRDQLLRQDNAELRALLGATP